MGWNDLMQSYSRRHIDVVIEDDGMGRSWRCTEFFTHCRELLSIYLLILEIQRC